MALVHARSKSLGGSKNMGSLTKAIKSATGQGSAERAIRQRLELLLVAAKSKIKGYRNELKEQFINPTKTAKTQIPGIRSIRYIEQYHVASSENFSDQCRDHLGQAIDSFFSIGGKDVKTKNAVKEGLKALISVELDAFIGSTEAGESEAKTYVVVPENNAFVRADICLWKYHMDSKQLTDDKDTAVAYVICKSVIDHQELKLDELIYLVSETLSKRAKLWVYREVMDSPDQMTNPGLGDPGFQKAITPKTMKFLSADGINPLKRKHDGKDEKDNWIEWTVDGDQTSGGTPPSIPEVEAYIDEIIRVWKKLREDKDSTSS